MTRLRDTSRSGGGLGFGQAAPRDQVEGKNLHVASLLDLAATKVAVVQKRAEAKDYLDIDVLPALPGEIQQRLNAAVNAVDPADLPLLNPYIARTEENERMS